MRYLLLILAMLLSSCSDKIITMVKKVPFEPEWKFSEVKNEKWLPAIVPGEVHVDLLQNKVIDDPLFEQNELLLQWISDTDWKYHAVFNVGDSIFKYKEIDFIFEGLDTYADVFLNDSLLISADNMFLEWRVNGKKFLRKGENTIRVMLYSPVKRGTEELEKISYTLPANDPVQPRISPFIRKAPYQFGWDWSPRFLTMGIWKPIKMVVHDQVYISDIHVRTIEIADNFAWLTADITIQSKHYLPNATVTVFDAFKQFSILQGETTAQVRFSISNPELWWPNGYGEQPLYNITAKLYVIGYFVDSITTRTGIRTLNLLQDDDEWGRSFYFAVNGLPIFMKGANYVPQNNFLTSVKDEDYRKLITDAASVGMNMLRVWGGGIYEKEIFYNLCDEKGILVWQDFMFACSMNPGDVRFLNSVQHEIKYQVKRLRNHPSIALWCGNNEMEVAWLNWGWQKSLNISPADSVEIYSNYKKLFEKIIPDIIESADPSRPYVPTSPLANWGKRENFNYDNMHYWGVWHGEEAIDSFQVNVPRFMSEYGMQSWPSATSLRSNTNEPNIKLNSDFIRNRQRSYKGNSLLIKYVEAQFGKIGNVDDLCYLSQLNQAEAMRIAVESQRRDARFCMGTLYWQLNDVWDGASWSTIEHKGKWKAAHHSLKRLYSKNIIIAQTINDTTRIWLQSESTKGITGQLVVEVLDFKGRSSGNYQMAVSTGYLSSVLVFELPIRSLLGKKSPEDHFLKVHFTVNDEIVASTNHFFVKPVNLNLMKPDLKYDVQLTESGAVITIFSNELVKGLMLEFMNASGDFSDNYFDLLPGETRKIAFVGTGAAADHLKVRWLGM